jgi:hypothetical protein
MQETEAIHNLVLGHGEQFGGAGPRLNAISLAPPRASV